MQGIHSGRPIEMWCFRASSCDDDDVRWSCLSTATLPVVGDHVDYAAIARTKVEKHRENIMLPYSWQCLEWAGITRWRQSSICRGNSSQIQKGIKSIPIWAQRQNRRTFVNHFAGTDECIRWSYPPFLHNLPNSLSRIFLGQFVSSRAHIESSFSSIHDNFYLVCPLRDDSSFNSVNSFTW